MYAGKRFHNFITGGHINFILGAEMRTTLPQRVTRRMVAMATPVS